MAGAARLRPDVVEGFSRPGRRATSIDKLAEHDEPVTVFCVHDADAFGTMIYQTFQDETKARGARKIKIINLGLEPEEALADRFDRPRRAWSASGTSPSPTMCPGEWREWLQTNRVELNAMTMPVFIAWLDAKMAEHGTGKLIPPVEVLTDDLEARLEQKIRQTLKDRILREAGFDEQVAKAMASIARADGPDLVDGIQRMFGANQERSWREHVETVAADLVKREGRL